jgi:hypothetical protein
VSAWHRFVASEEEGSALFEVLLAVVVLIVVLLPVAYLVANSTGIVGNSRSQSVGSKIATVQLAVERSLGIPTPTPNTPAAWTAASPATTTVGGQTYNVYVAQGWCGLITTGSGSSWGNNTLPTTNTPQPSYFVAVKVAWGSGASSSSLAGSSVVMSQVLPGTTNAPAGGVAIASCPLGLA